jgi:hypothetical protein
LMAWAVSRVFLKDTRRYDPRERADFAGAISVAEYRTYTPPKLQSASSPENPQMCPKSIAFSPLQRSQIERQKFPGKVDFEWIVGNSGLRGLLTILTVCRSEGGIDRVWSSGNDGCSKFWRQMRFSRLGLCGLRLIGVCGARCSLRQLYRSAQLQPGGRGGLLGPVTRLRQVSCGGQIRLKTSPMRPSL